MCEKVLTGKLSVVLAIRRGISQDYKTATKNIPQSLRAHCRDVWPGAWSCTFSLWASLACWEHLGCRYREDNCDKLYFTLDTPILTIESLLWELKAVRRYTSVGMFYQFVQSITTRCFFYINRKALIKQKHHAELTQFEQKHHTELTQFVLCLMVDGHMWDVMRAE